MSALTLAELAALQGDKFKLKKPLGEGAYAEVGEALRLLESAARRVRGTQDTLEHAGVPFDRSAFKRALDGLNDAFWAVAPVMLMQADLETAARRPK
jgi:hypothetical protein